MRISEGGRGELTPPEDTAIRILALEIIKAEELEGDLLTRVIHPTLKKAAKQEQCWRLLAHGQV